MFVGIPEEHAHDNEILMHCYLICVLYLYLRLLLLQTVAVLYKESTVLMADGTEVSKGICDKHLG